MKPTFDEKRIKKNRTKGTAHAVLHLVRSLELSSLLADIYMETDNPFAKELMKKYEVQLVLAHEDPEQFEKSLHTFYNETAKYIKKNHLYKEFYSFAYFVFSSLSSRYQSDKQNNREYNDAMVCYYDLLFQQMNYFVPHPKIAYGLDVKGKPILREEPFPNLDVAMMEAMYDNATSLAKVYEKMRRRGFSIYTEDDFKFYHANDQLTTNMILVMAYFINENTMSINPKEFYLPAKGIDVPSMANPTKSYKELLREKMYLLPIQGVKGVYQNCGNIKEVFYQEIFTENRVVLLYKVTANDGGEFCGFYDNKLECFFSPWDNAEYGATYQIPFENFILESYCYLTTDMDEKKKELGLTFRVFPQDKVPAVSIKPVPSVQFIYQEKTDGETKSEDTFRLFEKEKYTESVKSIHPHKRKLPKGAKASQEAIELAKQYRYVLREDETFVRPFERKVYRKKSD